jgi:hypothetical protein
MRIFRAIAQSKFRSLDRWMIPRKKCTDRLRDSLRDWKINADKRPEYQGKIAVENHKFGLGLFPVTHLQRVVTPGWTFRQAAICFGKKNGSMAWKEAVVTWPRRTPDRSAICL